MPMHINNSFDFFPPVASALPAPEMVPTPDAIFISVVTTAWFAWQVFQTGDLHALELGRGRRLRDEQFQRWMQWYELMGHSRLDAIRFAQVQTYSRSPSHARFAMQGQQVALPHSVTSLLPGFAKTEEEVLTVLERYPWLFRLSDNVIQYDADAAQITITSLLGKYSTDVRTHDSVLHILGRAQTGDSRTNIRLIARQILQHYFDFAEFDLDDPKINPNGQTPATVFQSQLSRQEKVDLFYTLHQHHIDNFSGNVVNCEPVVFLLARARYPERYGWTSKPTVATKARPAPIFSGITAAPVHPVRFPAHLRKDLNFFPDGTGEGENWTMLDYPITPKILEEMAGWNATRADIQRIATNRPVVFETLDLEENRVAPVVEELLSNPTFRGGSVRFLLYRTVEMGTDSGGEMRRGRTLEDVLDFILDRSGETPKVIAVKSLKRKD